MSRPDRSWMSVAAVLRDEILAGTFKPGDRLPTGDELAHRYGVHPMTVQTALDRLVDEGLVKTRRGAGRFVAPHMSLDLLRTSTEWTDRNTRRSDARCPGSLSPDFDFRSGSRSASTDVAKALRIDPGSSVWARFRWQRHDDQVLHHSREYLPQWVSRHPALRNALRDPQAQTYDLLRKAGHRLVRLEETVEVVSASADEAEMLGLDVRRPAPVTRITRIAFGAGDRPLEVNHIVAPARRITLRYDLPGFA